jgi:hypothetical protein
MLLADTRLGKGTSEQTHVQCQEEELFFGHSPMNLKLDRLGGSACVG